MKADLLNGICEVRPGESEVLQGASETPACNQSSQPAPEYQVHTAAGEGEGQKGEAPQ